MGAAPRLGRWDVGKLDRPHISRPNIATPQPALGRLSPCPSFFCRRRKQMMTHIASALVVFAFIAAPLSADLGGITTKPINIPSKVLGMTVGPDGNVWILTVKTGNLGK